MKFIFLALLLLTEPAYGLSVDSALPDAAQEARARHLFSEIRCVVCQGEAIADSPAEVARDMRAAIRQQIAAGESDPAIKEFLVSRYGEGVLMRPPLQPSTYLLWLGPFALLILCMAALRKLFR